MTHAITIAGIEISHDNHGRINLNALHKASGQPKHKAPNRWLLTQVAQEQISELRQTPIEGFENRVDPVRSVRGGFSRGTYADLLLAISYAGWICAKFQLTVNRAYLDLKTQHSQVKVPKNYSEALRIAADQAEHIEKLQHSEDALNRISISSGNLNVTKAAKTLQINPKRLFHWLKANKWTYRDVVTDNWTAYQPKLDQGLLIHKAHAINHPRGSLLINQVFVTPKGLTRLAKEFGKH